MSLAPVLCFSHQTDLRCPRSSVCSGKSVLRYEQKIITQAKLQLEARAVGARFGGVRVISVVCCSCYARSVTPVLLFSNCALTLGVLVAVTRI